MKKSIIFSGRDFFIYNKEKYYFDKINEVSHLFKFNRKVIIIEEELRVKQFKNKIKKFKMDGFVNDIIENDFPQNGDILYDYESKNNIISIYYIKGAKRIEKLLEDAKDIEVKPIQFIIKTVINKVLKSKNFTCNVLIKFDEFYYYNIFDEGLFTYGIVEGNKESVLSKVLEDCGAKKIYIDESAIDILPLSNEIKFERLDIRRFLREDIHKKQKFYS